MVINKDDIFNGIFGYQTDYKFNNLTATMKKTLQEKYGYVNNICFGTDYFMKYWPLGNHKEQNGNKCYRFYDIHGLAFGYFISNLIENVLLINKPNFNIGNNSTLNKYFYPIGGEGKEAYRMKNFDVDLLE